MTNTNTTITLTGEQIALLLQILTEKIIHCDIEPSEMGLAKEVCDILEEAETDIFIKELL